jgi:tetratricopeptide (TPR) repeat protein
VEALRGDIEAAARHHGEALRWIEDAVGPEHPEVAFVLSALADVQRERGDLPAAFAHLQRAEALLRGARVPDTRRAELWSILANTLVADGRAEEARAPAERAIAAFRAAGPAHESQAEALRALLEEHAPK